MDDTYYLDDPETLMHNAVAVLSRYVPDWDNGEEEWPSLMPIEDLRLSAHLTLLNLQNKIFIAPPPLDEVQDELQTLISYVCTERYLQRRHK